MLKVDPGLRPDDEKRVPMHAYLGSALADIRQLAAFAMMVENSFAASAADMAGVLQ
jgi:hypothetical protein